MKSNWILIFLLFSTAFASKAQAWGRRGHATVCSSAALLLAESKELEWLSSSTFDLGVYCNVPDLVWKKGDLYKVEWTNHFMDLEIFDRAFRSSKIVKPFELDRLKFNEKFPEVKDDAGRAYWRIQELIARLKEIVIQLNRNDLDLKSRHQLQADWLVTAGAIGHYVGDMGQPLHTSENYDGQLTHQKGIHSFFEDKLVDQLFQTSWMATESEVAKLAKKKWGLQKDGLAKKSDLQLIEELTTSSNRLLNELLTTDRRLGRKNLDRALVAHRKMILERMAEAATTLAEIWRRQLSWKFNGERFYNFEGAPAYMAPPTGASKT